jgi:hypothetical protein
MKRDFVSYAFQDLPLKKIKKYATQYDGVDMTVHLGANEDNFPFLVKTGGDNYAVMIWNAYCGMMTFLDEDPVRDYATVQFLKDKAYPLFDSLSTALTDLGVLAGYRPD